MSETSENSCHSQLAPLKKTKEAVIESGGMWGLFEQNASHRPESRRGLQLDSKIQELVWLLDYMCETMEGVPLNELALYLTSNLKEKSKKEFKAELIVLGKSLHEIDVWFTFVDNALKNEQRKLDPEQLRRSIERALPLLLQYKALGEAVEHSPNFGQIESADKLYKEIEQLVSSDAYLIQALTETRQVPHWDINESVGGS